MTKKQIDELTQRIDDLEGRLNGIDNQISQPKQHNRLVKMKRTKIQNAEPQPLEPLTPEETEFLLARGFDPEQRIMSMKLQSKQLTPHDREMIQSIRKKRTLGVTYFV